MMIVAIDNKPIPGITERYPGQYVEGDTRAIAHEEVDKTERQKRVLAILGDNAMTAKEVAVQMYAEGLAYSPDRNNAAPRLTELRDMGKVEVIGKKRCTYSGKQVSVYRRTEVE